jgi:RecA-family ATPase
MSNKGAGGPSPPLCFLDYEIVLQPASGQTEISTVALTPTAQRLKLLANGYAPIPVEGKRPPLKDWQKKTNANAAEIDLWGKVYPYATNTGVLTQLTPTLDIDITNPEAADAVEALARERFEERGYVLMRTGQAPKRAILLRTDTPFKKITGNVIASNGDTDQKIELLADGQQVVVFGIHPKTGKPYSWFDGEPSSIKQEDLPYVSEADAKQFITDAVALLVKDFGYGTPSARPTETAKGNGRDPADWAWLIDNIEHGRELHDSLRDLAGKLIASSMAEGAVVNFLRGQMDSSSAPRDARWQARYDDIPRIVAGAAQWKEQQNKQQKAPRSPLPFINTSNWDNEPVPDQEWAVLNRIPLKQCVLFSGEGAAGKSTVYLQQSAAHVLARDWLGTLPEPGPAIYIDAEDDEKVIHRRLAAITNHYQVTFGDLIKGGLHLISLAGQDAVLAAASRNGKIEPTPLYKQLLEAAGDIKPIMMGFASSANVYAGSEIDRSQVQQFISLLTRLAITANGSVVLISHPSLTGINTDTGLSGTTQWHNAVRARFYMKSVKPEDGEQPDTDLREIVFKKNNYGAVSESIVLRYSNGLFLPLPGIASLDRIAKEAKADDVFLDLLRRFTAENRNVSDKKGPSYAPALFAREDEAKRARLAGKDLEAAMRRLFKAGKIWNEPYGRPSRPHFRIARKG